MSAVSPSATPAGKQDPASDRRTDKSSLDADFGIRTEPSKDHPGFVPPSSAVVSEDKDDEDARRDTMDSPIGFPYLSLANWSPKTW